MNILIGLPAFGLNNTTPTTLSLYNTGQFLAGNNIPSELCYLSMGIVDARNTFLTVFYDGHPHCSHLLMVDADMEYPVELIRDMLAFNKPVVGCFYAKRQMPGSPVGWCKTERTAADIVQGHIKVDGVGGGILLIRRDAVAKMLEKFPGLSDPKIGGHPGAMTLAGCKRVIRAFDSMVTKDGITLSEDLSFSHRWTLCGGEVWANVNHVIGHHGMFNYAVRYADFLEDKARNDALAKMVEAA